jgi:ABC-type dipeptide/oligopeptide/nickel transport system permease component
VSAFLKFIIGRLLAIPVTLFVITALLYGVVMFTSPEERANLYWPPRTRPFLSQEQIDAMLEQIIEDHGLRDSYFKQYSRWAGNLLRGDWGYSPVLNGDVLEALLKRTPVTAELTLYSVLLLIPLGLVSGVAAGWRQEGRLDAGFRTAAFVATSVPPFILGLFLLSFFYVGLHWFPPGRTGIVELSLRSTTFKTITGLLTVDGLLNGRLDVTEDALRHLVLPVFTLSLTHWATLGRVTRAAIIDEAHKEYIVAARARGLPAGHVVWRHAFRNALLPALTSTALSAASLVTGVYVVETIFGLKGVSYLVTSSMLGAPDAALALGFAVYSVLLVLPLMLALDVLKALVDPRIREESLLAEE